MSDPRGSTIIASTYYFMTRFAVLYLIGVIKLALANVDVYVSKDELNRLIGVDSQFFYVKNGEVNSYAARYNMTLREQASSLRFVWRRKTSDVINYWIRVEYSKNGALEPPTLSIPLDGELPVRFEEFTVYLRCIGTVQANVEIRIYMSFDWPSLDNPTKLILNRELFCRIYDYYDPARPRRIGEDSLFDREKKANKNAGYDHQSASLDNNYLPVGGSHSESGTDGQGTPQTRPRDDPPVSPINMLFIAVGCVSGFIVIVIGVLVALYYRTNKYPNPSFEPPARLTDFGNGFGCQPVPPSYPALSGMACNGNTTGAAMNIRRNSYSTSPAANLAQAQPFLRPSSPSSLSKYSGYTTTAFSAESGSKIYSPVPSILMFEPRVIDVEQVLEGKGISRDCVTLGTVLLEGHFGEVVDGLFHQKSDTDGDECEEVDVPVVLKTVKNTASDSQMDVFLREGFVFDGMPAHSNVNQVLVTVSDDVGPPMLIYRYSMHGNLKQFLVKCRLEPGFSQASISTQDLVFMGIQIVSGVMHLHRYRVIHRDIAVRNCVLDDHLVVRICDTALSRDLFPADYDCLGDNENRPIKWLALESLTKREFSTATDVWSVGVTLWELMTFAQQPFLNINPFDMESKLIQGTRLYQPYSCPDELFGVIHCCWARIPERRPTLSEIHTALQTFYDSMLEYV